ncbi:MAG: N(4)-(beta-N-acetylglucosaminyl)-L-asparaginase [Gemmatimonadetes bacterium]|nr:N(4)-(beta-N-acetylglucosaminyl)-L-asparaginase [Gemmatimonadota bacterium]
MPEHLDRRDFLAAGAIAGASLAFPATVLGAPSVRRSCAARPVVIASANGNASRNADGKSCVQLAYERMVGGTDVLDALIAGVNIVELDPADSSVGYGGLPNADGVVQLDSCCMHGPRKRAGGVAALEGVRTPSLVARAVLENTDHHLLVGAGAQQFARQLGFTIEPDLNTAQSRALWLEWKRRLDPGHWLDPKQRTAEAQRVGLEMVRAGLIQRDHYYGTINCDGINAGGEICGVTTTSGLAWKIPGRVGDSPILGAGLYVDNDIGAAGSTGRGEANLYGLCSFLIVECLRQGMSPRDAALEACRRIRKATIEKRLLNARGLPNFGIHFYVLNARGEHAGVGMYPGASYAVCDERGPRLEPCTALLEGTPED